MNRTTTRTGFFSLLLALAFALTACGGGGGEESVAPPIQWPQPVAFTDFTGGQSYFDLGALNRALSACQTCITLRGVARSSIEMAQLLPEQRTATSLPAPYSNKLFSELPIDYTSKMAVVLEDLGSGLRYRYAMQKVEESADTVTISVLKCMVYDVYQDSNTVSFGLLIPKTPKSIQVLLVPSGKPTLPIYEPNGLGAC